MTYLEAKAIRDRLDRELATASEILGTFPCDGPMGLTPDHVKAMPSWQAAKRGFDAAFGRLRTFNAGYVKQFKKEIAAERKARRG